MYAFASDFIVFAVHQEELALPEYSTSPQADVAAETHRWTQL